MTSSFKSSARLSAPHPSTLQTITSTTVGLSKSLASNPESSKYWCRNYGIGPRSEVKQLTKGLDAFKYKRLGFTVGHFPVEQVDFDKSGETLLVACGPRVSLYGGRGAESGFVRALSGKQAQAEVDLFGGKKAVDSDDEGGLNDIKADRQISTGGHLATSASNRSDGRLVAIGTEGGQVRVCDASSRATLRTFSSSKSQGGGDRKSVRDVCWMRDGKRIVSAGDDGVVRVWNVGSGEEVEIQLVGHGDSVRCVEIVSYRDDKKKGDDAARVDDSFQSEWSQLVVSGSYDHTIRVWDVTNAEGERCTSVMNHGDPVQALLVLPPIDSGYSFNNKTKYDNIPLLVSAGGTMLKIWNPITGSCIGSYATKHAKTITCMCLLDIIDESDDDNSTPQRKRQIITAGLDGLLRIHSATPQDLIASKSSLPFLHGMQFPHPISSIAIASTMSRVAIGFTTGTVHVHQRRKLPDSTPKKRREPKPGTYSYFMRGAHEKSHDPDDYLLQQQKKVKLAEYDVLLRKFRYGDALDKVLETRQPQNVSVALRSFVLYSTSVLWRGRYC